MDLIYLYTDTITALTRICMLFYFLAKICIM